MKKEAELVLLGALNNRTEEEEARFDELISSTLDWAWITGQLIRHRIDGNFYSGLTLKQKGYIIAKVRDTFRLLTDCYKAINNVNLSFMQELFPLLNDAGIVTAGLKGVVYNTSMYSLGTRKSNDADILVAEEDLSVFDKIMRELGFIQSLDGGRTEASKKDKLMQRMNHHDLVPYFKRVDLPYIDCVKVDVNFQFDDKDNEITRAILDEGVQTYEGNGFKIQGLKWTTHLCHLCVHYYREATNSLWTSKARDVDLYKLVDIENSFRRYTVEELKEWTETIKKFRLQKHCYYTLYYLNKFYPNSKYEILMDLIRPDDESYVSKIIINGSDRMEERKTDFIEQTFDMNYGQDFTVCDLKKIY